jgi:hypothetical protein
MEIRKMSESQLEQRGRAPVPLYRRFGYTVESNVRPEHLIFTQ